LVHPSFYPEGMSNVCLEAASCGRGVITTKRTGCRETVDDGVTGYLVEEQNGQQLTNAVKQFLLLDNETRMRMGQMGRAKMEKEFDRKKVTETYMDAIRELLNDK